MYGGGIFVGYSSNSTVQTYNMIVQCSCLNNNSGNLAFNVAGIGDNSGTAGAGGASGVGGGGGGASVTGGGAGGELVTGNTNGGGIFVVTSNNTINNCSFLNNNSSNLVSNIGGAGYNSGSGVGAGSAAGGIGGGRGGTCMAYTAGGGVLIQGTNNNIQGCSCLNNNIGNLSSNSGGNSFDFGGAGVGGGGGRTSATCYTIGGGIDLLNIGNSIENCNCSLNNSANLSFNTGGVGASNSGGAGVGSGGYSAAGISSHCYTIGGGIYLAVGGNTVQACQCTANNTSNLCANSGQNGGAGVGDGGGSGPGIGNCYTTGGGILLADNNNDVNSCQAALNNTGNLVGNSSITAGNSVYTDAAGIYFGAASYNVVNSSDMTSNVTCGIQVGSPIVTSNNTLTDNLVMNCFVKGTPDNTISSSLDGIVSYATTTTNIFENNVVKNCRRGFVAAATTALDRFSRNTAFRNTPSQYVNIPLLPVVNTGATGGNPASNLTIP